MEFQIIEPRSEDAFGAGRSLLGLTRTERARRMLVAAGLNEAGSPGGANPLVLYPAAWVAPAPFGRELAAIEPGADEVVAVSAEEASWPVLVLGSAARSRLVDDADPVAVHARCLSQATRYVAPATPVVLVQDHQTAREAHQMLLRSLRKPIDGVVSRTLNRPVSLFMSSFWVRTPLTPNMLTTITFMIALAAAVLAIQSEFVWATLVMQFASILDGCDGEVARLKYQSSKLGGWLDNVFDDLSNMAFILGMGIGLYRDPGVAAPWNQVWLWAGIISVLAMLVSFYFVYSKLLRRGIADPGNLKWGQTSDASAFRRFLGRYLEPLVKRDFYYLFFLVLALCQIPWMVMVFSFLGAVLAAVTIAGEETRA